jgi:hypothetical protein
MDKMEKTDKSAKTVRYFKRTLKKKYNTKVLTCFTTDLSYNPRVKKYNHSIILFVDNDNIVTNYSINRHYGIDSIELRIYIKNHDLAINFAEILEYIGDIDTDNYLLYYKETNYVMIKFLDDIHDLKNKLMDEDENEDYWFCSCKIYDYGEKKKRNPKLDRESKTKSANKI